MSSGTLPRRTGLWLGVAAGLLNVNFLLELVLTHRSPIMTTMVSDLATSGRELFWAFRAADATSAVLLLVLAVLAWRCCRTRTWRAGTVLLGVFAASTLLAVLFPEHCAMSTDASCPTRLVDQGLDDAVHDLISSVGTSCGVLACLVFAAASRGRRAELVCHLVAGVLAAALGLVFVSTQQAGAVAMLGLTQRAQIVVLSAWYAVVGWSVDGHRAARARAPATMPS
ncbi:DUF998 domain-containing protein [Angustibacter sp. McL0619]|uniref:DUF998 domain-containing protein n=1 Tax=Angustibacter sp. McL0619 TaxID=3415676 RepID=UPI003CE8BD83